MVYSYRLAVMDLPLHGNLFVRCGAREMVFALVPSLALVGTLVVASPIWHWPRYGAALHFLIPLYIAIAVSAFGFNCFELKDDK